MVNCAFLGGCRPRCQGVGRKRSVRLKKRRPIRWQKVYKRKRFDAVDVLVVTLLTLWMLLIIIPFVNAIAISFATQKEYVDNPLMLFPSEPTLKSYELLFNDLPDLDRLPDFCS